MTLSKIKKMKDERGFTIVELLIVVVVIAILAAIVIVAYNGIQNRAKTSKAQSAASSILKKVEAFNAETGSYPTGPTGLTSAASTASYYVPAGTVSFVTTIGSAPTNENTIMFSTCTTPGGIRVSYWDYSTGAVVHTYTGGATSSSTCTATTS